MVIQVEDCVDVLQALYGNEYEYVFLFDHSCGHDRKRADGLDWRAIRKNFGGKQPIMHASEIARVNGYLGKYEHAEKLLVGDIQSMIFSDSDKGPFWMTSEQRESTRTDIITGEGQTKDKTNAELIVDLRAIQCKVPRGAKKARLVELARINGILLTTSTEKVKEGWVGKAKGMMQVLWERGFIDAGQYAKYTVNGPQDEYGNVDKDFCLSYQMSQQYDFAHEDSLLQHYGKELGIIVDRTPKCHPEMAGEGIEYSWGCGKNHYRALPLSEKRSKKNFLTNVRKCMSSDRDHISIDRVRLFSRRARRYMVAYYKLAHGLVEGIDLKDGGGALSTVKIESVVKACKTHRCAMDFDAKFIAEFSP